MAHRPNPLRVKIHHSYSVEEIASLLGVHKNTVRNWIKDGLQAIDDRRPTLVHGLAIRTFLRARRQCAKRPCKPHEIYCVKCRSPKHPAEGMVDYVPLAPTSGNLRGLCPDCGTLINKRVALAKLHAVAKDFDLAIPDAEPRIGESACPPANCDSGTEDKTHENAQSG